MANIRSYCFRVHLQPILRQMSSSDNAFEDAPRKGNWYPLCGHTKPAMKTHDLNMKFTKYK